MRSAKKARKEKKKKIKENQNLINDQILDNYLRNHQIDTPAATSTPISRHGNTSTEDEKDKIINNQNEVIKQLRDQLEETRKEASTSRAESLETERNKESSDSSDNSACCSRDPFRVHDKTFGYTEKKLTEELQYDDQGNVHIGYNVYCNLVSYTIVLKLKILINVCQY